MLSFASYNHFGQRELFPLVVISFIVRSYMRDIAEAYFLAGYTYCEPMHSRIGNSYAFWIIVARLNILGRKQLAGTDTTVQFRSFRTWTDYA